MQKLFNCGNCQVRIDLISHFIRKDKQVQIFVQNSSIDIDCPSEDAALELCDDLEIMINAL